MTVQRPSEAVPTHCPECGKVFASMILYEMHRIGRTRECTDVTSDLMWRVNDKGHWTTYGHRSQLPEMRTAYSGDDHRSEGIRRNMDDPAGGW